MQLINTPIQDLLVIHPIVFKDSRGLFFENWNLKILKEQGLSLNFVQENTSLSHKGVLRGLHFQNPPFSQGKLVQVLKGKVLDVVVDIRKNSVTYGKSFSIELSDDNKKMLWIPSGFAHGFLSLEDDTIFNYKCTEFYNKDSEGSLLWNDKDLAIDWGVNQVVVSEKDANAPLFCSFVSQF
mgnify:CR=1 FL=1